MTYKMRPSLKHFVCVCVCVLYIYIYIEQEHIYGATGELRGSYVRHGMLL